MADHNQPHVLLWYRDDLRIADHGPLAYAYDMAPARISALYCYEEADPATGRTLLPLPRAMGAACRWWLRQSLHAHAKALADRNITLYILRGDPAQQIPQFCQEHQVTHVAWQRRYMPHAPTLDRWIKEHLTTAGMSVQSFPGFTLHEPWEITKADGGSFQVYTPYSKAALRQLDDCGVAHHVLREAAAFPPFTSSSQPRDTVDRENVHAAIEALGLPGTGEEIPGIPQTIAARGHAAGADPETVLHHAAAPQSAAISTNDAAACAAPAACDAPDAGKRTAAPTQQSPLPHFPQIAVPHPFALHQDSWWRYFGSYHTPGEHGAQQRLERFLARQAAMRDYAAQRDVPSQPATSELSPHLRFGEISPARIVAETTSRADADELVGSGWAATFFKELLWRDFAWSRLWQHPTMADAPVREKFSSFPWTWMPAVEQPHTAFAASREAITTAITLPNVYAAGGVSPRQQLMIELGRWQAGLTGVPLVDAGMRQLWLFGTMHNRIRMVVGSWLTKNLLIDWRHGERWFWETLVDADHAANPFNWQWVAGCGDDAAPYFRIFNPLTQAAKFDASGAYQQYFLPDAAQCTGQTAVQRAAQSAADELPLSFPDSDPVSDGNPVAHPRSEQPANAAVAAPCYPATPMVAVGESRKQALAAYETIKGL
ncbi:cryptochrome/photolyase family protein [Corynebacterium choanae]|uniref:Deoxyribodipyrimidine photo-lyase n=1 Tax=Corynebacterium choanae TaxID=1862358 RepID=A0A3G6J9X0_9CORY|nr:deoxyribodipyrimidine photo-lyase [Corynebacterium choanae]AZA14699.1 Deoxyribodipyrimidine photo-lyase [Corynebacterium choanae]